MNAEEEIIKNKNMIRMNEVGIKAIVNLLSKEGILTHEEFEEEINNIVNQKK